MWYCTSIPICFTVLSIIKVMIFSFSYRENPSLGDPNSLIEELLEMRNKIRIRETDLIMVRGKVHVTKLYTQLLVLLVMLTYLPSLLYSLSLSLSLSLFLFPLSLCFPPSFPSS